MIYTDLRDWIQKVDECGELRKVGPALKERVVEKLGQVLQIAGNKAPQHSEDLFDVE
jgi:hypothetical protein